MQIVVLIPDFTTLAVALNASQVKGRVALVVDSTGLKVYGEGEWKVSAQADATASNGFNDYSPPLRRVPNRRENVR